MYVKQKPQNSVCYVHQVNVMHIEQPKKLYYGMLIKIRGTVYLGWSCTPISSIVNIHYKSSPTLLSLLIWEKKNTII